jgi:hypothetical protein
MLNFAIIWPGSLASLAAFQGAFMPCGLLFPSSSFAGTNANFTNSASLLILPALLILWLQLFSHSHTLRHLDMTLQARYHSRIVYNSNTQPGRSAPGRLVVCEGGHGSHK